MSFFKSYLVYNNIHGMRHEGIFILQYISSTQHACTALSCHFFFSAHQQLTSITLICPPKMFVSFFCYRSQQEIPSVSHWIIWLKQIITAAKEEFQSHSTIHYFK